MDSVVKIFPSFDPANSTFVRPDGKVVKLFDLSKYYHIYFRDTVDYGAFRTAYNELDSISSLTQPQQYTLSAIPSDSLFPTGGQWYLNTDTTNFANIHTVDAWNITTGDTSQLIGLMDSGVEGAHEDINGRVAGGFDIVSGVPDFADSAGHGTGVAGVMIAKTNNDTGMAAINWNARLYAIKGGDAKAPEGIAHADSVGVDFLNMSFGSFDTFGDPKTDGFPGPSAASAYNAWIKDMSLVASKGNDNVGFFNAPSDFSTVIGVGACSFDGSRMGFSNFGNGIEVVAPSPQVTSTRLNSTYGFFGGTSVAAPITTAVLSLIGAADTTLVADEIEEIMRKTAKDVSNAPGTSSGYDTATGYGVVQAGAAVEYVKNHIFIRMNGSYDQLVTLQNSTPLQFYDNYFGGLSTGIHSARQFSARKTFDFSQYNFGHVPDVLIRRRSTDGWEIVSDSVREIRWAQVVPGTATSSNVTVETGAYTSAGKDWPCGGDTGCTFVGGYNGLIDIAITLAVTTTPGDADNNTSVDVGDVNYMIARIYSGGPDFPIRNDADVNFDCTFNLPDLSYLIAYIFSGGPAPLDSDCMLGSLKSTPGGETFVLAGDVALDVGSRVADKRELKYNASRKVNALSIRLKALNGSKIDVTKTCKKSHLYWSQDGADVIIGLIDPQGKDFFLPSDTDLVAISGDFEIVSVEATDIHADGTTEYIHPNFVAGRFTSGSDPTVGEFSLDGAFPNPFNPETQIAFSLPVSSNVKIEIYNILGQRVVTVTDKRFDAGSHRVRWNSQDESGATVASGMYFARMTAGEFSASKKLVIMK